MIYIFYTVHVVVSLFLILVVLLQQGKGADLSVFGGGGTQTAFGARGAATILHKLTVICFVLFILTTLSIGILQTADDPTVMSDVEAAPDDEGEDDAPLTAPAGGTLPADGTADAAGEAEGTESGGEGPADESSTDSQDAESSDSPAGESESGNQNPEG